ncbi:MAG: hypothetical protein IPH36_22720 [Saprospiraceae bacterium]|nr:hypothetical protein [Saprospiraceae bacterium]
MDTFPPKPIMWITSVLPKEVCPVRGNSFSFKVCAKTTAVGSNTISFYAYRPSFVCNTNQIGIGCSHKIVTHTFNIIQPYFGVSPPLTIQHATNGLAINEICSGDPVKFDMPIPSSPNVSVTWEEYNPSTSTWITLTHPDFNGSNPSTFTVTSGVLTINCNSSTTGFEDKLYRARIKVLGSLITPPSTLPDSCIYYSTVYPLRI